MPDHFILSKWKTFRLFVSIRNFIIACYFKTSNVLREYKKDLIIFSLAIMIFIALNEPITNLFNEVLVNPVFKHIDSAWYNDIFFFIISLYLSVSIFIYRRVYIPSTRFLEIFLFISIIYTYYRFWGVSWEFVQVQTVSFFRYADLILVIFGSQGILFAFSFFKDKPKSDNNSFLNDEPIGTKAKDELGYEDYAEQLSEKILSSKFDSAFAIGINGKWGLGKTSFIDLVKRKINEKKQEKIIELDFNPWNSQSPGAIIKHFFESIQQEIQPYHSHLSWLLFSYSNKLMSVDNNRVTQLIQSFINLVTGFDSVNSYKKEIGNSLKEINWKILIYIDDLDRLDKNEILEVIRLIRNTANFPNTFFLVAYDRNYVINALSEHNDINKERFLEKIFQIEINLPFFESFKLRHKLSTQLKSKLPERLHKEIETRIMDNSGMDYQILDEWLENIRDVTRLTNTLSLNLNQLIDEVDFYDFLRIELLRLKFPTVYELLYRKRNKFFETSTDSQNQTRLIMVVEGNGNNITNNQSYENNNKTKLQTYLEEKYSELFVTNEEIEKIIRLVQSIFTKGELDLLTLGLPSHLSIVRPSRFYLYFAYNLLVGILSEAEFVRARRQNQSIFNSKIGEWVKQELEMELQERFLEVKAFDSKEDFERVIRGIFYFANQPSKVKFKHTQSIIGYSGNDLLEKLGNQKEALITQFYSNNESEFKNFVKSLFYQAESPYLFESSLARELNHHYNNVFPLSKEKLNEINIEYLRRYCNQNENFTNDLVKLFENCANTEWISQNGSSAVRPYKTFPAEAQNVMINFILEKDLDGFLRFLIFREPTEGKLFSLNNQIIIAIFGNLGRFQEYLWSQNESQSSYLIEFKKFIEQGGLDNFINFTFSDIPV